jgi:tRNA threonylcarbamoyladenosine biosynthesis protein TsaB
MTRILAIDTTGPACSVAVTLDKAVLYQSSVAMQRGHAEALLPMVQEALRETGKSFSDLDAIAVTTGPGAFTGIRIGLAAARGIALAADIPAIGISVFQAYAEAAEANRADDRNEPLWVLIDSKRGDLFVQRFTDGVSENGLPEIMDPEALIASCPEGGVRLTGSGLALLKPQITETNGKSATAIHLEDLGPPDVIAVAACAERLFVAAMAGEHTALPSPSPLYLRAPEAKLPKTGV